MVEIFEIKCNSGVIFTPLYCKNTTQLIHDVHVNEICESLFVPVSDLAEIIIDVTQCEIRNFDYGNLIIAHQGSGFIYMRFVKTSPLFDLTGTYFFPTVAAMSNYKDIVETLNECMQQGIEKKTWENVTLFRRLN
ncbi:hypothetical protein [Geomonas propionica]|uniref:Uncharacterized protein n=1 Tax=Geomonas propionica TaxID=2798582 RepID=A0ABS0YXY3_9BACT|nr:hypothetical protein [Geomonas propionica]MBJ6802813.1 hypothetical protein [Geomonas propionica]